MKRSFLLIALAVIAFADLFAGWEGNSGTGSAADFPSDGFFVRSDSIPRHTVVQITNLEKNITAKAVVFGNLGVPGLLVTLSPKLAAKLKVFDGAVVRVSVSTASHIKEIADKSGEERSSELPVPAKTETKLVKSEDSPTESTEAKSFEPASPAPVPAEKKPETKEVEPVSKTPADKAESTDTGVSVNPVEEDASTPAAVFYDNTKAAPPKITPKPAVDPVPEEPITPLPAPAAPVKEVVSVKRVYLEPTSMRPPITVPLIKRRPEQQEVKNKEETPVKSVPVPKKEEEKLPTEKAVNEIKTVKPKSESMPTVKPVGMVNEINKPNKRLPDIQAVKTVEPAKNKIENNEKPAFNSKVKTVEEPITKTEAETNPLYKEKVRTVGASAEKPEPKQDNSLKGEVKTVEEPINKTEAETNPLYKEKVRTVEPAKDKAEIERNALYGEKVKTVEPASSKAEAKQEQPFTDKVKTVNSPVKKDTSDKKNETAAEVKTVAPPQPKPAVPQQPLKEPEVQTSSVPAEPSKKEEKMRDPAAEIKTENSSLIAKKYIGKPQKGKFYIQIAVLYDEKNIQAIINKYGNKYPIFAEKAEVGGKQKYTIFIGPLQKGEIGAALEQFKTFGFKDAFFKTGK